MKTMHKKIGVCLVILWSLLTFNLSSAQRIAMIDMKGHPDTLALRLVKEKGFTSMPNQGDVRVLKGKLNGEPIELKIYSSPIGKRVWMATAFYVPQKNYKKALVDFEFKVQNLVERYGKFESKNILKKQKTAKADWGYMQYFQNLQLVAEIVEGNRVAVHFILRDERIKHDEEKKLSENQLF
jgi:hypothetical protein